MLMRGLKDRRIGMVTVTGVDLSPDLRHAKVWVTSLDSATRHQETLLALNHAAGWIRRELGQRIRMKFAPELVFLTDTSQEECQRIDALLDQIRKDS
jgi:ribosome-binding factor A